MVDLNTINNIDCLEYMKKVPDKFFDLILTDPPYGINMCEDGRIGNARFKPVDWDNEIPSAEIFKEMLRVSKNQVIFGGNYFTEHLPPSQCWIVWDKNNPGLSFADAELAWTSFQKSVRMVKYTWNGYNQELPVKEIRYHPTQKPVGLGRWILNKYAKEGDLIFDPFAGSGSFLLAAKQLGFQWVGCELDHEYCEVIRRRMAQKLLTEAISK